VRTVAGVIALGALALVAPACSKGGGGAVVPGIGSGTKAVCELMERLDATGATVERADVKDPTQFTGALAAAVKRYGELAAELRRVVPDDLRDDVERLQAAVEQYRFGDAVDEHAALEAYAARECS
jgi:hypothetical protein